MAKTRIHQCECDLCRQPGEHPEKEHHHRVNVFFSRLDEQQRRWYAALEAERMGHGGQKLVSQITGLSIPTIQRGREELGKDLAERPEERARLPGGGRKPVEKNNPE
jgi:hypothetical protein